MSKHTQGPWAKTQNFRGIVGIWPDQPGTNKPICFLSYDPDGPCKGHLENWDANANLIAAAPDLYAELCRILSQLDPRCSKHYEDYRPGGAISIDLAPAYAALDKAEGKA